MSKFDKIAFGLTTLAVTVLTAGPALAGGRQDLPAPGIMGLVAGGVIAAIAVARLRK